MLAGRLLIDRLMVDSWFTLPMQVCWLPRQLSEADVALLAGTRDLEVQQETPIRVGRAAGREPLSWWLRFSAQRPCLTSCCLLPPAPQVLHRRANLCRPKVSYRAGCWRNTAVYDRLQAHSQSRFPGEHCLQVIHELRAEALEGPPPGYFALHLRTQAGTYIKEFVHGGSVDSFFRAAHRLLLPLGAKAMRLPCPIHASEASRNLRVCAQADRCSASLGGFCCSRPRAHAAQPGRPAGLPG